MFQSTDSSNDEINGFDGESHANGKGNKISIGLYLSNIYKITLFRILTISLGGITHTFNLRTISPYKIFLNIFLYKQKCVQFC